MSDGGMHPPEARIKASMSKHNSTTLSAGIDVAKTTLQLSLAGTSHPIDNDARGHARILKLLRTPSRRLLALLDRQIAACEQAIAAQIAADEDMAARAARLQQVPGVGAIIAGTLQAHLPELGRLSDGEAAGLAGLAPYPFGFAQGLRQTAPAAPGKARGASAEAGLPHAARSTWPH